MASEFTGMDDSALVRTLAEKQRELVQGRFALSMNRLENTASLRTVRRDIARINGELRRREISEGLPKDSLLAKHRVDLRTLASASSESASGGLLADLDERLDSED